MNLEEAVSDFQHHVGAPTPTWPRLTAGEAALIAEQGVDLRLASSAFKNLYKQTKNNAFLRVELMLEELGEVLEGISQNNQEKTLDGLVDTAYVVIGTATSFNLPFTEAFEEVHRSNMTKSSRAASHSGDKGKGSGFSPANIAAILSKHHASS